MGGVAQAVGRRIEGRDLHEAGHVDQGRRQGVDLAVGAGRAVGAQAVQGVDLVLKHQQGPAALFPQPLFGARDGVRDGHAAWARHLALKRRLDVSETGRGRICGHRATFIGFNSMSISS